MAVEPKKVLVVDDEANIVEVVKSYLENNGYLVAVAFNGEEALELFDKIHPGLVILDLMLPDISGEQVCKQLRKKSRVPIIMLTAKVEEADILNGLDLGADDYVTKPFSPRQLVARVEALFRRVSNDPVPLANLISYHDGELVFDVSKHEIRKNGQPVNLTPNEYKIIMTLLKYAQKVFTREELVLMALGDDFDGFDRTIDAHIKNLRQKVELDPKTPKYILTVHGVGYRFGGE